MKTKFNQGDNVQINNDFRTNHKEIGEIVDTRIEIRHDVKLDNGTIIDAHQEELTTID